MEQLNYTQASILEDLQKGGVKTFDELKQYVKFSDTQSALELQVSRLRKLRPDVKIKTVRGKGYCIPKTSRDLVGSALKLQFLQELERGPAIAFDLERMLWPASRDRCCPGVCHMVKALRCCGAIIEHKNGIVTLQGWKPLSEVA